MAPVVYLIETEFLFGLIPGDLHNKVVKRALSLVKAKNPDVRCLASGLLETIFVAKARGKKEAEIRESLAAMLSKLRRNGIRLVELIDAGDLLGCLSLRELYHSLSFYDALHASSALNRAGLLISNDKLYDRVAGLRRVSFDAFVTNME